MSDGPSSRTRHPLNQWIKGDQSVCMEKTTLLAVGVQPQSIGKLLSIDIWGKERLEVYLTPEAAEHVADLLTRANTGSSS